MSSSAVYSFDHLFHAAGRHLRSDPPDPTTSILYSALAFESFLNHLGEQIFSSWRHLERRLGPQEKLQLIADHAKISLDFGIRPFQSFVLVFEIRDDIVHSRPELTEGSYRSDEDLPKISWRVACTPENADRILDDARRIIEGLPEQVGVDPVPTFVLSDEGGA